MYKKILDYMKEKPAPYTPSTAPFWDDEHISRGMLAAHLNFEWEAASRKRDFIVKSAQWITRTFYSPDSANLLDLGCGPGIYAELFCRAGFNVTGVDFSNRSIEYAKQSAAANELAIEYEYADYLEIEYEDMFNVATLIYCDFGVLPPDDRRKLLYKIRKALRPGGVLILDGFTQRNIRDFNECRTVEYNYGGYWRAEPYMCIQTNYLYPETDNYLEQYIIVTEGECECYNTWNQVFSSDSLGEELEHAGFEDISFYDDVAGSTQTDTSKTICATGRKPLE